ncbi:sugar transferase [candidate division WWE3 bacterium]|nr:sugar transferase [candidate division WWE3 bacterium]
MRKSQLFIAIFQLIVDYTAVISAFSVAYWLRSRWDGSPLVPFGDFFLFAMLAGLIYVLMFGYLGLYAIRRHRDLVDQLFGMIVGGLSATALSGSIIYFGKNFDYSRLILGTTFMLSIVFVWFGRLFIDQLEHIWYRKGFGIVRTLLIGSGSLLTMTINGYSTSDGSAFRVIGLLYTGSDELEKSINGVRVLGTLSVDGVEKLIKEEGLHEVVVADSQIDENIALDLINLCEMYGVVFKFVPDTFEVATARVVTHDLAGLALIELRPTILAGWMLIVKRVLDLIGSICALVLLSPLFVITAIAIRLDSNGPIIFKHRRVGRNGVEFDLYKFRSMYMVEKNGQMLHASENTAVEKLKEQQSNYKLENDPRVTKVGSIIRKMSIDELPQFINVIRGELSLVGPRAYLAKELEKQQGTYPQTKELVRRLLAVKPGITGLWQVSGRSNIDFKERVAMDAYYATHATIWMDIKLLFQTIPVVLKGSGAM